MRSLLSELPLALGPKWVDPDFLIETFGTIGILVAAMPDQAGCLIGRKAGPAVLERPDGRFFKQEHVHRSRAFFDRHGPRSDGSTSCARTSNSS